MNIWKNYPKFRVHNYKEKYQIQIKRIFWPCWYSFEEGYYGVETYWTFRTATERLHEILTNRIKENIARKQAKENITGEALSTNEYIKKFPEEFL